VRRRIGAAACDHALRKTPSVEKVQFSIFVNRKFTSLLQRPFTKAFDGVSRMRMAACVCRAGNAD
jgi:hypothetical protein